MKFTRSNSLRGWFAMIWKRPLLVALFSIVAASGIALGAWYDDYEAGIRALRAGQWSTVIQRMTLAISQKGTENNRERAYGPLFENYHPFYYRAVAYLNTGQYEKAIADLDRATGPGQENLGSIDDLRQRTRLGLDQRGRSARELNAARHAPAPMPVRPGTITRIPRPAPSLTTTDMAARQRADVAIAEAGRRIQMAKVGHATESPAYREAVKRLADANLRRSAAKSTSEFTEIAALAESAAVSADSARRDRVLTAPVTATRETSQPPAATGIAPPAMEVVPVVPRVSTHDPVAKPPSGQAIEAGHPSANTTAWQPPSSPSPASSVEFVDQVLKQLAWGSIAFNAPATMGYQQTQQVELLLSPSLPVAELQAQLQQKAGAESASVRIANRMEATLTGESLSIQALTPDLQAITSEQTSRWRWLVTPTSHGRRGLHLALAAHIDVAGRDTPLVIRTFDRVIDVEITAPQRLSGFVESNWQWLWAAVLVPLAGYLWGRRKRPQDEPKPRPRARGPR